MTDMMTGLKNKVLDAATYELLRRNFELLEENNTQLKDKVGFLEEEVTKLKAENLRLIEKAAGLQAEVDMAQWHDEFVECQGLAFQKNPDGTVKPVAYCPECQERMTTIDHRIYICRSCKYTINAKSSAESLAEKINEKETDPTQT